MSLAKRFTVTTTATLGAFALLTGTALAHDCYVPTKSLNGPVSDNWHVINVPQAAEDFGMLVTPCPAQVDAGIAALRADGLPLSIKVFMRQTIGEKAGGGTLTNGKGLENFAAGSTLADEALMTYVAAASSTPCAAV